MICQQCKKEFNPLLLKEVIEHEHKGFELSNDIQGKRIINNPVDVYPNANPDFLIGVRKYLKNEDCPAYPENKDVIRGYYCAERDLKDHYILARPNL